MKVQMNKGPASGALHGWMALKIDVLVQTVNSLAKLLLL